MKKYALILCAAVSLFLVSCSSNDAENFVGNWMGAVVCDGDEDDISMSIALGTEDNTVTTVISDFGSVNGTVDGDNLTLTSTTIEDITLSGSGTLNEEGTTLTVSFTVSGDGETLICPAVLTK